MELCLCAFPAVAVAHGKQSINPKHLKPGNIWEANLYGSSWEGPSAMGGEEQEPLGFLARLSNTHQTRFGHDPQGPKQPPELCLTPQHLSAGCRRPAPWRRLEERGSGQTPAQMQPPSFPVLNCRVVLQRAVKQLPRATQRRSCFGSGWVWHAPRMVREQQKGQLRLLLASPPPQHGSDTAGSLCSFSHGQNLDNTFPFSDYALIALPSVENICTQLPVEATSPPPRLIQLCWWSCRSHATSPGSSWAGEDDFSNHQGHPAAV
ncbi:hypothetical protein DV515_00005619 [Chloebia gouldiae]|uniref:Uncharacterized protein n=1 Tax=Chloebia gouldiae TaxID=44316 RepID=A0A3L8SN38_CHLGU|nr:hypothetical protein DV515_00005619 [Chloebia gouldiae]